jgi:hypothetical protein
MIDASISPTWTTFPAGGGGLERGRLLARLGLRLSFPSTRFNVIQVPGPSHRQARLAKVIRI